MDGRAPRGITIGQLATYAGVTIKAVRHYHQRGLLEEPPRDASGYRRYSAEHAIRLVKIKILAEAGAPLARIKELLAASSDRFAAALGEIDRKLALRMEELQRTRERIARLNAGDRLFVSAEVADYLERLQAIGVSQRVVQLERDMWSLYHTVAPEDVTGWIAEKMDYLNDPEFCAIYLDFDAAFDWPADDPRLPRLADQTERWLAKRRKSDAQTRSSAQGEDLNMVRLLASSAMPLSPAWKRLAEIGEERRRG